MTRLKIRNSSLVVSAMKPRACVAEYDAANGHFTLQSPSQGVFGFTNILANRILNVPRENVHMKTPNVGGSFGMKSSALSGVYRCTGGDTGHRAQGALV